MKSVDKKTVFLNSLVDNAKLWENASTGYMLVDKDNTILYANDWCVRYFSIDLSHHKDSIILYKEINASTLEMANRRVMNYEQMLFLQNFAIDRIYQIVVTDKIPVQFIYFILKDGHFISLLVHFIPVLANDGSVIAMQQFISRYDMWGIVDSSDLFSDKPQQYISLINSNDNLPVKLSSRQQEIMFLLTNNIGVRTVAQILKVSYGSVSKIIRDYICPKFNIDDADTTKLVSIARKMGYNKFVPQSLCNPCLVILDVSLRNKYFTLG